MRKTREYHVSSTDGFDPSHVRTHESILSVAAAFAIAGRVIAVLAFLVTLVAVSRAIETGLAPLLGLVIACPLFVAIPVGFYFYGASLVLLFTRNEFLNGPIGRKWLKVGGVESALSARICYVLLLVGPLLLLAVIVAAIVNGDL